MEETPLNIPGECPGSRRVSSAHRGPFPECCQPVQEDSNHPDLTCSREKKEGPVSTTESLCVEGQPCVLRSLRRHTGSRDLEDVYLP